MIKNFTPQPYDGLTALPDYVTSPRFYTLVGYAPGDYTVTLARMTVGDSKSAGNPLAHVLFESFDDHGVAMKTARTRAGGLDREYIIRRSPAPARRCFGLWATGLWHIILNCRQWRSCHKRVIDLSQRR